MDSWPEHQLQWHVYWIRRSLFCECVVRFVGTGVHLYRYRRDQYSSKVEEILYRAVLSHNVTVAIAFRDRTRGTLPVQRTMKMIFLQISGLTTVLRGMN